MIVSIHLPKAGGTTFGSILREIYGKSLFLDYSKQWSKEDTKNNFYEKKLECLHGHFEHNAFDHLYPDTKKIIWLRNPSERIYSLYKYLKLNPDHDNSYYTPIYNNAFTFNDFIKLEWVQNNFKNFIKDSLPKDFYFIGFLEYFDSSLSECSKFLNWKYIPEYSILNKNNQIINSSDTVLKRHINKFLDFEIDWYEQAFSQATF